MDQSWRDSISGDQKMKKKYIIILLLIVTASALAAFYFYSSRESEDAQIKKFITSCVANIDKNNSKSLFEEQSDATALLEKLDTKVKMKILPYIKVLPDDPSQLVKSFIMLRRGMTKLNVTCVVRSIKINRDAKEAVSADVFFTTTVELKMKNGTEASEVFDCTGKLVKNKNDAWVFNDILAEPVISR